MQSIYDSNSFKMKFTHKQVQIIFFDSWKISTNVRPPHGALCQKKIEKKRIEKLQWLFCGDKLCTVIAFLIYTDNSLKEFRETPANQVRGQPWSGILYRGGTSSLHHLWVFPVMILFSITWWIMITIENSISFKLNSIYCLLYCLLYYYFVPNKLKIKQQIFFLNVKSECRHHNTVVHHCALYSMKNRCKYFPIARETQFESDAFYNLKE